MITRRLLISSAAAVGAAGFSGSLFAAAPDPVLGKDYIEVRPPLEFPKKPIVVHDFFAYTCPHCLQFDPIFKNWLKTTPADVSVRICAVVWFAKLLPFTQTYYALEAMGLLDKVSMPFFESVVYQERPYDFNDPTKDILDFMKTQGVAVAKFEKTLRSFGVMNKSRVATQTWQAYQIDSTPMIGVGGIYSTGPHLVGSREETPACIDFLIEEVRKTRR